MNLVSLCSGVTSAAAQSSVSLVHEVATKTSAVVQIDGITTATVKIEGRLDSSMDWVVLWTATADDAKVLTLFPEMRVNVTAYTSGTIAVRLGA